jgi:hypothetical protein
MRDSVLGFERVSKSHIRETSPQFVRIGGVREVIEIQGTSGQGKRP